MRAISYTWDHDDNSATLVTRRPYTRVEPVKLYDARAYFRDHPCGIPSDRDLDPYYIETIWSPRT